MVVQKPELSQTDSVVNQPLALNLGRIVPPLIWLPRRDSHAQSAQIDSTGSMLTRSKPLTDRAWQWWQFRGSQRNQYQSAVWRTIPVPCGQRSLRETSDQTATATAGLCDLYPQWRRLESYAHPA